MIGEAISRAETTGGDLRAVKIVRREGERRTRAITVNLDMIISGETEDFELQPNDMVFVPTRR